jgi:hypothetical protein
MLPQYSATPTETARHYSNRATIGAPLVFSFSPRHHPGYRFVPESAPLWATYPARGAVLDGPEAGSTRAGLRIREGSDRNTPQDLLDRSNLRTTAVRKA